MWIITKDLINTDGDIPSRVGKHSEDWNDNLPEKDRVAFRLLDDDRNVYYEGIISRQRLDGYEEEVFEPLDWAEYDAGCTIMQYKKGRKWEALN